LYGYLLRFFQVKGCIELRADSSSGTKAGALVTAASWQDIRPEVAGCYLSFVKPDIFAMPNSDGRHDV
jgi:hypothetical protein